MKTKIKNNERVNKKDGHKKRIMKEGRENNKNTTEF